MRQLVECHYRESAVIDHVALRARAQDILQSVIWAPGGDGSEKGYIYFHEDYSSEYQGVGQVPAATAIWIGQDRPKLQTYRRQIEQSWRCRNAEALLRDCNETMTLAEMFVDFLEPQVRLRLLHGVLQATVETTRPAALVFSHSQHAVDPEDYLAACDVEPLLRPGSLNVRFHFVPNAPDEFVMDTRGMWEIGLHDLQCHFRDLDPNDVSGVLLNTVAYIVEHGPVIESGETVEGVESGSKWLCQFEKSILEPVRDVLDLNPGRPFAAGNRR